MDGGNQNNSQGGDKKAQLSWSQPVTTTPNNNQNKQNDQKKDASKNPVVSAPASTSHMQPNNTFRNTVIIVVVLALIGIVWAVVASNKNTSPAATQTGTSMPGTTMSTSTQPGSSTITDGSLAVPTPQPAGMEVMVSNVVVIVPTWVVIYENRGGQPGNVLGAGLFVQGRTSGTIDLLRATIAGQGYFAGEARDDGDHMYSMQNDPAVRDADGSLVYTTFQAQ